MRPVEHYPFELPNAPHLKAGWHRARWKATREEIERLGGRICGPAEVRSGSGGTAGHVQSGPTQKETLSNDSSDDGALVRSAPSSESEVAEGNGETSSDDPAWRLLP
jgi:hypothetical protein